jgi:hypothetical protein
MMAKSLAEYIGTANEQAKLIERLTFPNNREGDTSRDVILSLF